MNNINMLQMGLNGTFLIVVIICFRHFFFHQIPKRFFVFLWICAIVRLLLPFSIPVSESAGSWFQKTGSRNLQMSGLKRQSQAEMRPDARSSSTEWAVGLSGTAFRERCDNLDALFGKNSADPDVFSVSADFGKAAKWVQNVAVIIYLKEKNPELEQVFNGLFVIGFCTNLVQENPMLSQFSPEEIYIAQLEEKLNLEEAWQKMKKDAVNVRYLQGINGRIDEKEYKSLLKS